VKKGAWKRAARDDFIFTIGGRGYAVRFSASAALGTKYFGFSKYGGKRGALRAARQCRDELVAKLGWPPRRTGKGGRRAPVFSKWRGNNTSGIVGVRTNGLAWIAMCHPRRGKRLSRSFAIRKYGYDGARDRAIAQRRAWVESLKRA
jgi:hypothetical protein